MKTFMDEEFMLQSPTASSLYHRFAENMPIIDYHCHLSPRDIFEDRRFDSISQVWLGGRNADGSYYGDHYKWKLMRANGVPEDTVTGSADPYDKFAAFTGTLEQAIGNPMYHWCNLELKRFFDIHEPLTEISMKRIYEQCSDRLRNDPEMSVRGLISRSNVRYVGTTDDPTDSLEWHERISADPSVRFLVCPSFRPDKAINIAKPGFAAYIEKLAASTGKERLATAGEVCDALSERLAFFVRHGCRASDHGLDYVAFRPCSMEEADAVFQKALAGAALTTEEIEKYQTVLLLHLAKQYHRYGIAMEIHYNCLRNVNERMFSMEGPDTGYDMIAQYACSNALAAFMSELDKTDELPKMILFSLQASDFDLLSTAIACFQSGTLPGKLQVGPAWWFLDTRDGMEKQMRSLANLGLLGNFIGMLTDSRSFLSYPRHEYFRRIFCSLIGGWVENGEYPYAEDSLKKIVEGVSCRNAARYFNIDI